MIHPTAIIHPGAKIHPTVEVGAYAIIDEFVTLGAGCKVAPHVHITGHTTIGEANTICTGAVLGGDPQDHKYKKGEPTRLRIGNGNTFREMVTIHCANNLKEETTIGDDCFLMATSHVAHNAILGNHIILANGTLIAGHCIIGDHACLSGLVAIHQFVRVGELAMIQGVSAMSTDVPPYTIAFDKNLIAGLNIIGLRRAGFTAEERLELKKLYKLLFRSGLKRADAIYQAEPIFQLPPSRKMIEFVKTAQRPIAADVETTYKKQPSENKDQNND